MESLAVEGVALLTCQEEVEDVLMLVHVSCENDVKDIIVEADMGRRGMRRALIHHVVSWNQCSSRTGGEVLTGWFKGVQFTSADGRTDTI